MDIGNGCDVELRTLIKSQDIALFKSTHDVPWAESHTACLLINFIVRSRLNTICIVGLKPCFQQHN